MLALRQLAEWARLRAKSRLKKPPKEMTRTSRMFADINQLFHERLLDACRRVADSPSGAPDVLFLALPERLLGKVAYMCLGDTRRPTDDSLMPDVITKDMIECLRAYDRLGLETAFANLATPSVLDYLKYILVCHGLSPIGDSILLPAELGRSFRVSRALGLPILVMLADISWMSSDRSFRRFKSLSSRDIDTGLRVCLDKRRRLYEALGLTPDLKEISPYDRAGAISGRKLEMISQRYTALATGLWGITPEQPLAREQVSLISSSLERGMTAALDGIPEHMKALAQFPRALVELENQLKPHLEILRAIARQFNTFSADVFRYFFAQYYAQDHYRGLGLKVAPVSEEKFDGPFDELDGYFRAWGEGHSTSQALIEAPAKPTRPLSAAYLPHYRIGDLQLLPYAPISIDALRLPTEDHNALVEAMLPLDTPELTSEQITARLAATPVPDRNRILSDLVGFLQLCLNQWSADGLNAPCRVLGFRDFDGFLESLPESLGSGIRAELDLDDPQSVEEMWVTWLKTLETDKYPTYTPPHMFFLMLDTSDWTEEFTQRCAQIVSLARLCYRSVV